MSITVYLYCTKAKSRSDRLGWYVNPTTHKRVYVLGRDSSNTCLNGSVCFKCECKEAFKLRYLENAFAIDIDKSFFYSPSNEKHSLQYHDMLKRSQMTEEQLLKYGKGKDLFALHLEKVDRTYPMGIAEFYKDEACTKPLTKAPQSWCYAYVDYKWAGHIIEKVIFLSVRPEWLCKIANGEKDLEVRKTCPKEIEKR